MKRTGVNMQELVGRFLECAVTDCRIKPGRILVAVSGGPDSVALLHLLDRCRSELKIEPIVGHVNHQLRREAPADAVYCEKLAQSLQLPFVTRTVDTKAVARARKLSIETAARELRYQALAEMAREMRCSDIAIGHSADDQAETVLFNLARGSGFRGLAGMPFRLGNRVRPLLRLRRTEILHFLKQQHISYRIDASNQNPNFQRNLIRHEVLPYLARCLNPNFAEHLLKISELGGLAESYFQEQAVQALQQIVKGRQQNKIILDIERFWRYFSIVRKYILRNVLEELSGRKIRPDFGMLSRVESLAATGTIGQRIALLQGWEFLIDHDGLVLWDGSRVEFDMAALPGTSIEYRPGQKLKIVKRIRSEVDYAAQADARNQYVDADKIAGEIRIRSVRPGDRFVPLGAGGTKKVLDVLADRKVPLHRRRETPLVVCETGIIWLVGQHLDERFKITEQTQTIYHLQIEEEL